MKGAPVRFTHWLKNGVEVAIALPAQSQGKIIPGSSLEQFIPVEICQGLSRNSRSPTARRAM